MITPLQNRTTKYLNLSFRLREKEFIKHLMSLYFKSSYIEDKKYTTLVGKQEDCIFMVFDIEESKKIGNPGWALKYFSNHKDYISSYINQKDDLVIIFKMQEECSRAINMFMKGKYSRMYTASQIRRMNLSRRNSAKQVIVKDDNYRRKLEISLKMERSIPYDTELDSRPKISSEVLNYA